MHEPEVVPGVEILSWTCGSILNLLVFDVYSHIRRPLQGSSGVWDPFCSPSPSFFLPLGMPKARLGLPPRGPDYSNVANGLVWP